MGQKNHGLLKFYPIADALAATFGKNIGIIVYDLRTSEHSIAYTINNQVVGPIINTVSVLSILSRMHPGHGGSNYLSDIVLDSTTKYSAIPLWDDDGHMLGLMCIFVDLTRYQQAMEILEGYFHLQHEPVGESSAPEPHINSFVVNILDSMLKDRIPELFDRQERMEIISAMERQGIFLVKGAIERVAERLHISKVTIYSYLDELRKENQLLSQ